MENIYIPIHRRRLEVTDIIMELRWGDVMYDNLFIKGIPFQEWKHDLGLDLGLKNLRLRKVKKVDRKAPK